MSRIEHKPRLAVVSPFLDKRHGTERRVVEWVSRLADMFEIHVYSQRVQDLDLAKVVWHRIPKFPGPHILNFLWWFVANRVIRLWNARFRGLRPDLIFSPGPNCLDADVISVHIVFAEYAGKNNLAEDGSSAPDTGWLRRLHRNLYYRLAMILEKRAYTSPDIQLILIARKTSLALEKYYGRRGPFPVLYLGLDHQVFNPQRRAAIRRDARKQLDLDDNQFALLLIGNDWGNKGISVLVEALALVRELPIHLLVAGQDDPGAYRPLVRARSMEDRVHFLPPRGDVEVYYAAADAYAGPSVEDTFAQPPAEAMACGLPVIVSAANGASEIMTPGEDGLILENHRDAPALAEMIRRLYSDGEYRSRLGQAAARTAEQYTWERNGRELARILEEILSRKAHRASDALAHESR